MWFLRELDKKTTFVLGSGKNAGKTTFLNLAARYLRRKGPVGLVTIGVDGEGRDLVFGNPKPLIPVEQGDVVVTTETALRASSGLFRVLDVFSVRTALGRLVLAEALRSDFVELVGPETNSQLANCVSALRRTGARSVLVDGAANRVTQVSSAERAGFVDVIRLNASTQTMAEERLRFLSRCTELPELPREFSAGPLPQKWWDVNGALTPSKLRSVEKGLEAIVVPHFGSLFLDSRELARLPCPLYVRSAFELLAVVVNSWDVDDVAFVQRASALAIHSRIWLNPYKERAA